MKKQVGRGEQKPKQSGDRFILGYIIAGETSVICLILPKRLCGLPTSLTEEGKFKLRLPLWLKGEAQTPSFFPIIKSIVFLLP